MANSNKKYASFFQSLRDERAAKANAGNGAASGGAAPEGMSEEDIRAQIMLRAALENGNFDVSPLAQKAYQAYTRLMSEGAAAAQKAGYDINTQEGKDFADYYAYMLWPQDMGVSYDEFYNAKSKRDETLAAEEQKKKNEQKRDQILGGAAEGARYANGAPSDAEISFWQNVFSGNKNKSADSAGEQKGLSYYGSAPTTVPGAPGYIGARPTPQIGGANPGVAANAGEQTNQPSQFEWLDAYSRFSKGR